MNQRRSARSTFIFTLLAFVALSASAATSDFRVLFDVDNSAATGCAVDGMSGVDMVLVTKVDTTDSTGQVTQTYRQVCSGGTLGAPTATTGGWDVDFKGESGNMTVETRIPYAALFPTGLPLMRVGFAGQSGTFVQNLGPVMFPEATHGRRRAAQPGEDRIFVLDGKTQDWGGISPLAQGSAAGGQKFHISRVYGFGDGTDFYFRFDASTLKRSVPQALNDSYTVRQGQVLVIPAPGVLANDTDADGGTLSAVIVTNPSRGPLTFNSNGAFTYAHDGTGTSDFFEYRAVAGGVESGIARVTITIVPNGVPQAFADSYNVAHRGTLTVAAPGVLANDNDPDGDPISALRITSPANGTLTLGFDGALTYTHNGTNTLSDSFTYAAQDGIAQSSPTTVNITIAADIPPTAVNDAYTVAEGGTLNEAAPGLFTNDSDPDTPQSLWSITVVTPPVNGALTIGANGAFSYVHNGGETTSDSFVYRINDGIANSNNATVLITVTPVNDAPVAANDAYTTNEDAPLNVPNPGVLANDTDAEGTTLTMTVVANPTKGVLTPNAGGGFLYTPNLNAVGADFFTYTAGDGSLSSNVATVNITITPINDEPTITAGPAVTVLEDSGPYANAWATGVTPGGGTDEAGQTLTISVTGLSNPALFAVAPSIQPDGSLMPTLTFTPAANANGTSTANVTVTDNGGTANGGDDTSVTVVLTINVTAVNDVPSFVKGPDQTVGEDAAAQTVNPWATAISAGPANEAAQTVGFVVSNNNNPLFSVQPAVAPNGTLTYTPAPNASGTAVVNVLIVDNGGTASGGVDTSAIQTFNITITPVNDAPINSVPVAQNTNEDVPLVFSVANGNAISVSDIDAGTNPIRVTLTVTNGTATAAPLSGATLTGNGTNNVIIDGTLTQVNAALNGLTFTPTLNSIAAATLTVTTDDLGSTGAGVPMTDIDPITINITAVNDAPSFTKGADVTVLEDSGAFTQAGWATGTSAGPADESAQTLTYNVTNDNNALFTVQPAIDATTGTLTFTLAANVFGTANVSVTLSDNGGTANGGVDTSAAQTFVINVTGVNDEPSFAGNGNVTVNEDSGAYSQSGWVTASNAGPNEGAQTLSYNTTNDNNALFSVQPAVDASGTLTFTPALNAFGTANVGVTVSDNGGTANGGDDTGNTVNFTITVNSVNDVPSFTKGADVTVNEDSGAYTQAGWIVASSPGPANEAGQTLSYNVTNDNNALFSVQPAVDSAGQLTFTPAANAFGTTTVTISVTDNGGTANGGVDTSATQTFTITITGINDEPSFTGNGNVTVNEDSGAYSQSGWVTAGNAGPGEGTQTLSYNATNDNNALFSVQPAVDASGTLTFTPALNQFGTANVSVTVSDNGGVANGGDDTGNTVNFTITVNSVNDVPSFTKGADVTVMEDSGAFTQAGWIVASSPGPANEAGQTLSYNVTNDNNALFSVQPAVDSAGQLTFTPAANAFGTTTVTISVTDNGGTANGGVDTSATQTFTITITGVNDEPSFTGNGNVMVNEDSGAYSQSGWVTAGNAGPGEGGQTLSYNATNDNNALFSVQPAVDASGTLTFTPALNQFGTANVSVTVSDNGGVANGGDDTGNTVNFTITVNSVNDVPSFTKGADVTVMEDSGAYTQAGWIVASSAGPANEAGQTLSYNVTNDNNALFSVQPAVDSAGQLTFTPAANAFGTTTVTISVTDNGGTANGGVDTSATQTFTITITGVNDEPSFTGNGNVMVNEDSGAYSQAGWVTTSSAGPGEGGQTLSYNATNDNNALFSVQPAVDSAGQLTFTPALNQFGTANVSVTVSDNGGVANGGDDTGNTVNFTITVNAVNDVPSFTKGADVTVNEDSGAYTQAGWIVASSAGPANEAGQTLSYNVTNDNNALFSVQPAVDSAGQLTFTPAANAFGTTTVTISVTDNGGTANGGVDTSATQTFTITITGINDEPSFTGNGNVMVNEDSGPYTQAGWVTASSAGPGEGGQTLSYNATNDNNALFSVQPAVDSAGQLTFTPAANAFGAANVSVTVSDNGGTAGGGDDTGNTVNFTITVNPVNDAPNLGIAGNITVLDTSGNVISPNYANPRNAGPANEAGQVLTFNVTNDNNAIFSVQPAINVGTGTLTFTPIVGVSGVANVTVTLSDDGGTANGGVNQTTLMFVINIHKIPVFTSANSTSMTVGSASSFDITVSGLPTAAISLLSGTLPANLVFTDDGDNTARIHGTPATLTNGVYNLVIRATNSAGTNDQNFTLTIVCPVATFTPAAGALPAGTFNVNYTQAIDVGQPGYTYAITAGALPAGVNLDTNNGGLSGIPTTTGNFSFTITATHTASGCQSSAAYTLMIAPSAVNDSYGIAPGTEAVGNTQVVAAGHSSPTTPFVAYAGTLLANDSAPVGATAVAGTFGTTGSGSVTIGTDGSFTYSPAAGFTGDDTFTYTLDSNGATATGTATVRVAAKVWYVRNAPPGPGTGRSHDPFDTLLAAQTASAAGEIIYVMVGNGTTLNQNAGILLKANQQLIGSGVALVVGSHTLAGAGAPPLIGNTTGPGVTLANNNALRGFNVTTTTGATLSGISGNALTTGPTIANVNIGPTTGAGLNITASGTITTTLTTVAITGAGTVGINANTFGTLTINAGVSVAGVSALALNTGTVSGGPFASVSSTGGTNGVSLTAIGGTVSAAAGTLAGATGATFLVSGGNFASTWQGNISQGNAAALVSITNHATATLTFNTGTLASTNGTGLQFSGATGVYQFNGPTTLNGGTAGIGIAAGSNGTFTFGTGVAIGNVTSPGGPAFTVNGSTPVVTYSGNITQTTANDMVNITNQAVTANAITFNTGTLNSTGGVGVNLSNADGPVAFNGTATLNGTTGIRIVAGTGGTITFGANTSITAAAAPFVLDGTGAGNAISGNITYSGTINKNGNGVMLNINTLSGSLLFNGPTLTQAGGGAPGATVTIANVTGTLTTNHLNLDSSNMNFGPATLVLINGTNTGGTMTFHHMILSANGANATGTGFSASGGGTVTITATGGNSSIITRNAPALVLNGVAIGTSTLNSATVAGTGSAGAVSLTTVTGTLNITSGALASTAGAPLLISGGAVIVNNGATVTQGTAAQPAISVSGGHTGSLAQSGNVTATNGTGLVFSNADGAYSFTGASTINGTTNGVSITTGSAGSFTFNAGTQIGNTVSPTGVAFNIDNAAATTTVTYNGTINTTANRPVSIQNCGNGTNISFTGNVTSTSNGILVQNVTGAAGVGNTSSITFSGGSKSLSVGANTAVTYVGAANVTLTFSNGGLVITRTNGAGNDGAGINASGGGTLVITRDAGTANIINGNDNNAVGNGTALRVDGVTIGTGGLVFQSISQNGGSNGIFLQNTGATAGLTVAGNSAGLCGGDTTANAGPPARLAVAANNADCTGGTLANSADGVATNASVYLNNTRSVSLTRMRFNGSGNWAIRGTSVVNFTLSHSLLDGTHGNNDATDDGPIYFDNLTGSATLQNVAISGAWENSIRLTNNTGVLNRITIDNSQIGVNDTNFGNDGILIESTGTATVNATVSDSVLTGAKGDVIDFNAGTGSVMDAVFTGNAVSNSHPSIVAAGGGTKWSGQGTMTYNISNNSFRDAVGHGLLVNASGSATTEGVLSGRIENNDVGVAGVANSGSGAGATGIDLESNGGGDHSVTVHNNRIRQYNNHGLNITISDLQGHVANLRFTVTNNSINTPGTATLATNDFNAFHLNAGTVDPPIDTFTMCLHLSGNNWTGGGHGDSAPNNQEFRLRQRFASTIQLPGYTGGASDTTAVENFIRAQNTGTAGNGDASVSGVGGGYTNTPGSAVCATP